MIRIQHTNSEDPDFRVLVVELDADLRVRDGDDHAFFAQYNKTDSIRYALVAYRDGSPVGCGAIRDFGPGTLEVKRMYVRPEARGLGIASAILAELETWARELQAKRCILETSIRQPEAIGLYEKNRYSRIPNYGAYADIPSSVCFEKML